MHAHMLVYTVTDQEGEEHADGRQEVPDVMSVVEVQQDAGLVALARLGRRQLNKHTNTSKASSY